jgi:hypothetical protein
MEPIDLLKKIFGIVDTSEWEKAAKLKPEDITKRRITDAECEKLQGEARVLMAKVHAIKARADALGTEWWEYLHTTYSLPRGRNYTLSDDHFILIEPKKGADKDE